MQKNSDNFSMQDALRMAQSDAGQQLFALLKAQNGDTLNRAMDQAAAGDYTQARQTLSDILASPQVQAMLKQMRRQNNG